MARKQMTIEEYREMCAVQAKETARIIEAAQIKEVKTQNVLFSTVDSRGNVTAYGSDGIADAIHNEQTCRQADATRYNSDFIDNLFQDIIDAVCETADAVVPVVDTPKLNSVFVLPDGTKCKLFCMSSARNRGWYRFQLKSGRKVLPTLVARPSHLFYHTTNQEYIVCQ